MCILQAFFSDSVRELNKLRRKAVCDSICVSSPEHVVFPVTQLKEVVLKSGKVLRADVCVIGAGDVKTALLHRLRWHLITAGGYSSLC